VDGGRSDTHGLRLGLPPMLATVDPVQAEVAVFGAGRWGEKVQMRRVVTGLSALVGLFGVLAAAGAQGATLQVVGGELQGATGVLVGSDRYDVKFVDGSCLTLYEGCDEGTDFVFNTKARADAASQALLDLVFVNSGLGAFDDDPSLTRGCEISLVCVVITPWEEPTINPFAPSSFAVNTNGSFPDRVEPAGFSRFDATTEGTENVFAVWAPASSAGPIPEPGAALLFAVGFAILSRRSLVARLEC
jgi:hypothetical protein